LNRKLLCRQLRDASADAIAITTIPIVADLVGELPVRKWVYYCVDDFSVWPGLDGKLLGRMEDELVAKVDCTLAVSDTLVESLRRRGCDPLLLTHGVDLGFWRNRGSRREVRGARDEIRGASGEARGARDETKDASCEARGARDEKTETNAGEENSSLATRNCFSPHLPPPTSHLILFWGVVDRRMNAEWVLALADRLDDVRIVLAGPQQDPDERLLRHPRIELPGPQPFERLPELAAEAAVLIMPYADLPVTRAMQPLKLKEYLATGRPVVVSDLPATRDWAAGLTIARSQREFVEAVARLADHPVADTFAENPDLERRLRAESWSAKAARMLDWVARG
jgi:glycosyltransferase involved in cell wall biosynthesis